MGGSWDTTAIQSRHLFRWAYACMRGQYFRVVPTSLHHMHCWQFRKYFNFSALARQDVHLHGSAKLLWLSLMSHLTLGCWWTRHNEKILKIDEREWMCGRCYKKIRQICLCLQHQIIARNRQANPYVHTMAVWDTEFITREYKQRIKQEGYQHDS